MIMVSHLFLRRAVYAYLIIYALVCAGIDTARAQEHATDNRIRAQLTSYQQTVLSAELAANISKLNLREGESFSKGQLLVEFDCALLNAQMKKANAVAEVARQALKVSKRLEELHSISRLEVDQAIAKAKETEAELETMRVQVSKCSLSAPYSGRIARLHVNPYQYVTPGSPLMDIVDTGRLEVRLIAPSSWLSWLEKGSVFSIQIEELGKTYQAQVVRLGARIDPISQSLPITGEIEGDYEELLPGMSGWAIFNRAM